MFWPSWFSVFAVLLVFLIFILLHWSKNKAKQERIWNNKKKLENQILITPALKPEDLLPIGEWVLGMWIHRTLRKTKRVIEPIKEVVFRNGFVEIVFGKWEKKKNLYEQSFVIEESLSFNLKKVTAVLEFDSCEIYLVIKSGKDVIVRIVCHKSLDDNRPNIKKMAGLVNFFKENCVQIKIPY